ncbi:MAG: hypothetical protein QM719_13075 [Thermomonas sp.]
MTSRQPNVLEGDGFRIAFEPNPGFLRAHVTGDEDSLEVSLAIWRLLGNECRVRGASRLLVVEDLPGKLTPAEVGVMVETLYAEGFPDVRIAFVELAGSLVAGEHGEILAIELGFTVQAFSREADARHWLMYGD